MDVSDVCLKLKGQLGGYLSVFSRDSWGILIHTYRLYRAFFVGISHRGMLVGVHPTIP